MTVRLVILLLALQLAFARVHFFETFLELQEKASPICKKVVIQNNGLRGSNYEILSTDVFKLVPEIEDLYIINKVKALEPRAFEGLQNLRSLTFEENELVVLRAEDFSGLRLPALGLVDNNITVIEPRTFANSSIDSIDLSHNSLSSIQARVFDDSSLKQLSLSDNNITRIAERAFSIALERLDLSRNRIRDIPITIFENLFELRHLNVSHNRLPTLASALWLRSLEVLDASYNSIRLLFNGAFEDYPNLRELRLDHNEMLYLNSLSFVKPSPIEVLRLDRNMLTFLPSDMSEIFPNLTKLIYGGNPWSCTCLVHVETFIKTNKIRLDPCEKDYFTNGNQAVCLTAYPRCYFNETLILLEHPAIFNSITSEYKCTY